MLVFPQSVKRRAAKAVAAVEMQRQILGGRGLVVNADEGSDGDTESQSGGNNDKCCLTCNDGSATVVCLNVVTITCSKNQA